uniref:BESS domain-containing protein n=1 Tax=Cacopsylla melanoneura TaxID=428564 RepID=A0A8D8WAA9_9HEMI
MIENDTENDQIDVTQEESIPLISHPTTTNAQALSTSTSKPQSRKRKHVSNDNISLIAKAIDKLDGVVQKNTKDTTDDEIDMFAKYIAIQLRHLPAIYVIDCQEKIQSIITNQKRKVLREGNTISLPPTTYYSSGSSTSTPLVSPAPTMNPPDYWSYSHNREDYEQPSDILSAALNSILPEEY